MIILVKLNKVKTMEEYLKSKSVEAVNQFIDRYPDIESDDLQAFVLGFNACMKLAVAYDRCPICNGIEEHSSICPDNIINSDVHQYRSSQS